MTGVTQKIANRREAMTDQKEATRLATLFARLPLDQKYESWPTVYIRLSETDREVVVRLLKSVASQSSRIDTATDAAMRAVDEELARRALSSADRSLVQEK